MKAAVFAAAFLVSLAGASPSIGQVHPIVDAAPSAEQIEAFYPDAAQRKRVDGRVVLDCVITAAGTLTGCGIVEEAPTGYDFGAATVRAASRFHLAPTMSDGSPSAGRHFRLPVHWVQPHTPPVVVRPPPRGAS